VVLTGLIGGVALLTAFCFIEQRVDSPMFDLKLLRIRAFAAGGAATLLASIARWPPSRTPASCCPSASSSRS
jgi:hypothetical protein